MTNLTIFFFPLTYTEYFDAVLLERFHDKRHMKKLDDPQGSQLQLQKQNLLA